MGSQNQGGRSCSSEFDDTEVKADFEIRKNFIIVTSNIVPGHQRFHEDENWEIASNLTPDGQEVCHQVEGTFPNSTTAVTLWEVEGYKPHMRFMFWSKEHLRDVFGWTSQHSCAHLEYGLSRLKYYVEKLK